MLCLGEEFRNGNSSRNDSGVVVNGIIKTADYSELITDIYGGGKYPLMAVMDIPYEL